MFFDLKILKSTVPPVFSIGVGNLSVGGTGKTPTIGYLIESFKGNKIAVLSRGYGRKTKGYLEVSESETTKSVGDEIKMLYDKYHHLASFHVCEDRAEGTSRLIKNYPETEIILYDDVFQNRYIKPHVLLLLTTAQRPFFSDYVVPTGNLRESRSGFRRADAVVFTKLTETTNIKLLDKEILESKPIFFSKESLNLAINHKGEILTVAQDIIAFSGLAQNHVFENVLAQYYQIKIFKGFKDHFPYTKTEIQELLFMNLPIVTTEKDYVKIKEFLTEKELLNVYYVCQSVAIGRKNQETLAQWLKNLFNNYQSQHSNQS